MDSSRIKKILLEALTRTDEDTKYAEVTQHIFTEAYENDWNGFHLTEFTNIFYSWALGNPAKAICAAKLCPSLMSIEVDGTKFRTPLFMNLQEDFQNKDEMKSINRRRWFNFCIFLCKLFQYTKVGSMPIKVLVIPIYSCLQTLLTNADAIENEIKCGYEQLVAIGASLMDSDATAMHELMDKIRKKILDPSTEESGRILLLQVLELFSGGWTLRKDSKKYYRKKKLNAAM